MGTNARIKKSENTNEYECTNSSIRAQSGFGLLEVLLASGILALVVGGVIGLGNISVKNTVISADRTKAYNLAREDKEILKQMRDTRWINQRVDNWNDDFLQIGLSKTCHIDCSSGTCTLVSGAKTDPPQDNIDFTHEITFESMDDDTVSSLTDNGVDNTGNSRIFKAKVKVSWQEYGRSWSVEMPVYFSDWMPAL